MTSALVVHGGSNNSPPYQGSALTSRSSNFGQPYKVYLLNDDYNMREYVARSLMMVCSMSEKDASMAMMQANWDYNGRALVGIWEKEVIARY